jgi:hypothetical protein
MAPVLLTYGSDMVSPSAFFNVYSLSQRNCGYMVLPPRTV